MSTLSECQKGQVCQYCGVDFVLETELAIHLHVDHWDDQNLSILCGQYDYVATIYPDSNYLTPHNQLTSQDDDAVVDDDGRLKNSVILASESSEFFEKTNMDLCTNNTSSAIDIPRRIFTIEPPSSGEEKLQITKDENTSESAQMTTNDNDDVVELIVPMDHRQAIKADSHNNDDTCSHLITSVEIVQSATTDKELISKKEILTVMNSVKKTKKKKNTMQNKTAAEKQNKQKNVVQTMTKAHNGYEKPPLTLPCLITMALMNCENGRLNAFEIQKFICSQFPFFRHTASWQTKVSDILTSTPSFQKIGPTKWGFSPSNAIRMQNRVRTVIEQNGEEIRRTMTIPENLSLILRRQLSGKWDRDTDTDRMKYLRDDDSEKQLQELRSQIKRQRLMRV